MLCLREILNKALETGMGFGKAINRRRKITKGIICWIRNMDMAYMTGEMGMCIRDSGWMTFAMARAHYCITMKFSMTGIGRMVKK